MLTFSRSKLVRYVGMSDKSVSQNPYVRYMLCMVRCCNSVRNGHFGVAYFETNSDVNRLTELQVCSKNICHDFRSMLSGTALVGTACLQKNTALVGTACLQKNTALVGTEQNPRHSFFTKEHSLDQNTAPSCRRCMEFD